MSLPKKIEGQWEYDYCLSILTLISDGFVLVFVLRCGKNIGLFYEYALKSVFWKITTD